MNIFQEAANLENKNLPFAIATITEAKGSTPRNVAKMIIKPDGKIIGTIGGGLSEAYIIKEALKVIKNKQSCSATYVLNRSAKKGLDMDCGGKLSVFIEYIGCAAKLVLIGGGHVSLAIAKMAEMLDLYIIIVENREEFGNPNRFPFAHEVICHPEWDKALDQLKLTTDDYIVLVTGSWDELTLKQVIKKPSAYIGMMGSRRKVATIMQHLKNERFSVQQLQKVHAPIGLDIGAETPEEIAISILSEIMKVKSDTSGQSMNQIMSDIIVIRGGGDIATGVAHRLYQCGYQVVILETDQPTVIRRFVAFAQALLIDNCTVEGVEAKKAENLQDVQYILRNKKIPVLIDPKGSLIQELKPKAVIDAIIAKKNMGTLIKMAPVVIGLGPGFKAGKDVHAVIETNRGHQLGKVILNGSAEKNTNTPGNIDGYTIERLLRSPKAGMIKIIKDIGDTVKEGDVVASIGNQKVKANISGVIRGMISNNTKVTKDFKIGDIDPRGKNEFCYTISDKARAIAGGVLEALLQLTQKK